MAGLYRIFLLATTTLLLSGCVSAPRTTDSREKLPLLSTRDGTLRYILPRSWIDASNELQSRNDLVWLLQEDYSASITVGMLVMSGDAAGALHSERLLRATSISLQLSVENDSTRVLDYPRRVVLGGRETMVYRFRSVAGDNVRVIIVDTGSRLLEVAMLVKHEAGDVPGHAADQDRLVESLRW